MWDVNSTKVKEVAGGTSTISLTFSLLGKFEDWDTKVVVVSTVINLHKSTQLELITSKNNYKRATISDVHLKY